MPCAPPRRIKMCASDSVQRVMLRSAAEAYRARFGGATSGLWLVSSDKACRFEAILLSRVQKYSNLHHSHGIYESMSFLKSALHTQGCHEAAQKSCAGNILQTFNTFCKNSPVEQAGFVPEQMAYPGCQWLVESEVRRIARSCYQELQLASPVPCCWCCPQLQCSTHGD